jgi:quercetin dioxygenase-like cupin family protein
VDIINLGKSRHFLQAKAVRVSLIDRPQLVCELLCLTPGQTESRRTQDTCDELYVVIEGHATLRSGPMTYEMEALDAMVVPPGIDRALGNDDVEPLTVLAILTPKPTFVPMQQARGPFPQRRPLAAPTPPPVHAQHPEDMGDDDDDEEDMDFDVAELAALGIDISDYLGDDDEDDEDPMAGEGPEGETPRGGPMARTSGFRPAGAPRDDIRGPQRSGPGPRTPYRSGDDQGPVRRQEGPRRGSPQRPHFEDNNRDERNSLPPERERPRPAGRSGPPAARFGGRPAPRGGGGYQSRPAFGPRGNRPYNAAPQREGEGAAGGGERGGFRSSGPPRPGSASRGRPQGAGGGGFRGPQRPSGGGPRGGSGGGYTPRGDSPRPAGRFAAPRGNVDGGGEGGASRGPRNFGSRPPAAGGRPSFGPPRGDGPRPPRGQFRGPASGGGGPRGGTGRSGPGRPGPRRGGPRG